MDVARAPAFPVRRVVVWAGGTLVLALVTLGLAEMRQAVPRVERTNLWLGVVERGPLVQVVRGPGTLVAEDVRLLTAELAGRVESLALQPGDLVEPDSVVIVTSNADVELQALEAERQLRSAQADFASQQANLEIRRLGQVQELDRVRTESREANRRFEASKRLAAQQLVAELDLRFLTERARELEDRVKAQERHLRILAEVTESQLTAQRQQIERMTDLQRHHANRLAQLRIRAGTPGVLQDLQVEAGQWIVPGTYLAKIVRPERLKAALRISETQAKDVRIGQAASVDTRNGVGSGRVSRIDPAASNGTVTIDIALDEPLPPGARPDLNVDGSIEIDRIDDTRQIPRPAYAQENRQIGMFRVEPDGHYATRVPVALGPGSVSRIAVTSGLDAGDEVILSDMSTWDGVDRVRLE